MLLASGIDASENSRSLSNDSLNPRPYTYNLVNVHLTKLMTGIVSYKNGIILYYFMYFPLGRFWHHFIRYKIYRSAIYRSAIYSSAMYRSTMYHINIYRSAIYNTVIYRSTMYNTVIYNTVIYHITIYRSAMYHIDIYRTAIYRSAI